MIKDEKNKEKILEYSTKIVIKRLEAILEEHESEWEPMFKHWLKELKAKKIIEGIIE